MPNIQNQKKRAITNLKRDAVNTSQRTALRTQMKNVLKLIEEQDKEKATVALNVLNSHLDKAVTSGIQHKNYASRQKARFAKLVKQLV
jgi:small subunit ribosomal protein S20